MKRVICLLIALVLLSTHVFAATYYDVELTGLTSSEKREVANWLSGEGKFMFVDELSSKQKVTVETWLKKNNYKYKSGKNDNEYYVVVKYTSSTKNTLEKYLKNKKYNDYSSNNSNSYGRTGKAYLVANGYLWYADGDDVEKVDSVRYPEYVLFTKDGGIAYINDSKKGICIDDLDEPTETKQIAKSVSSIKTNSSGYAISFKGAGSKTTKIDDDDFDNDEITVYVVKNNILYSLSSKNKLTKLKSLKYLSNGSYTNIGFSEWGDLVFIDSSDVCFYNEEIDDTDEIQILKDQNGYTVQARYFTVKDGIVKNLTLTNGSTVKLEDD